MLVSWSLMWIVGLICYSDCTCSQTSFYKSCWIRRYPGVYVDVEESQRRGAHILKIYHEDTASKCSRSCCTTRNFSCSLAVFHYNTTEDSVNCFHLHCSNPDSCLLHHRRNVILYNVTKGVDPDLLVFGKHFTTNVRVLPHMSSSRLNVSEPLTSDKRHFNHPPVRSITTKPTTAHNILNHLTRCTTQRPSTADERTSQQITVTSSLPKPDSTSHSQHHLTSTNLFHTTHPTNFPSISSTPNAFYSTTTQPRSTTPSSIILTTAAHSSSPSGTLTTQELQTTAHTDTNSEISELSSTNLLSEITESSQTTPQTEMTRVESFTTLKPLTDLQTNTPSQTTTSPTTTSQPEETSTTVHTTGFTPSTSPTISTSTRHVTLNITHDRTSHSTTGSGADSQPYPNDTKGYVSRNVSAVDGPRPGGSLTSVWRLAANTVLVVLGTCASVTLGCCCSVFAALSWRGRRRRKGRYRTDVRGKRGSMKLIKYVIVRESS